MMYYSVVRHGARRYWDAAQMVDLPATQPLELSERNQAMEFRCIGGAEKDDFVTKSSIIALFYRNIHSIYTVMLATVFSNMDSQGTRLWTKLSKEYISQ